MSTKRGTLVIKENTNEALERDPPEMTPRSWPGASGLHLRRVQGWPRHPLWSGLPSWQVHHHLWILKCKKDM